jgi:hypothetical protein
VRRLHEFKGYLVSNTTTNTGNSGKYTVELKVLRDGKKSTGTMCFQSSNFDKNDVATAIGEYETNIKTTRPKLILCHVYELMIRANNEFARTYIAKLALVAFKATAA